MAFLRKVIGLGNRSDDVAASPPRPRSQSTPSRFDVGWVTDVGADRDRNEDTALVITAAHDGIHGPPWFRLLMLADGMGGHRAGEVASSLAVRVAAHHITRQSYLPSLLDSERDANQPALTEVLVDAVKAANGAVIEQAPGSGTTLVCALILGTQAYIAHVGDSRAYVLTEEGLSQITRDHSVIDRLVDSGRLTPDEAAAHPQKNVLYRAIGQSGVLEVETHVRKIHAGQHLLLCSDGLWDLIKDDDIAEIIREARSVQGACEDLIAAANEAGGSDNITAILWRCPVE